MPYVSRTSNIGSLFKQASEPANWVNADLWADTDASPRTLYINNNGTALALGVGAVGDSETSLATEGAEAGGITRRFETVGSVGFTVKKSITLAPTLSNNIVVIVGSACLGLTAAATRQARIEESAAEVGSSTISDTSGLSWLNMLTVAILTDVSVATHTYSLAVASNHASTESAGYTLAGYVIE